MGNAEIYTAIGLKLKAASPLANTLLVTPANGMANSGYVPNDASFGAYTFQVLGSRLKPGCAEDSIVNGLVDLVQASGKLPRIGPFPMGPLTRDEAPP